MISEIVVWNVEIVVRNVPCSMWFSAVLTDSTIHMVFSVDTPYLPYDICLTFFDIGYNKDAWAVASILTLSVRTHWTTARQDSQSVQEKNLPPLKSKKN